MEAVRASVWLFLAGVAAGFAAGWAFHRPEAAGASAAKETVVFDTVRVESPAPVEVRRETRTEYVYLPRAESDTVRLSDTVRVAVPIATRVFADSLFRAEISGYSVELKSMEVYPRTVIRTVTAPAGKRKRWGIGVQAGGGMTPAGFRPYVGIGVTYTLWSF